MPLPIPSTTETQDQFLNRCMADPVAMEEFPDRTQRFAVCEAQWDKDRGIQEEIEINPVMTAEQVEQIIQMIIVAYDRIPKPKNGQEGKDGKTPIKGRDYFTKSEQDGIIKKTITTVFPQFKALMASERQELVEEVRSLIPDQDPSRIARELESLPEREKLTVDGIQDFRKKVQALIPVSSKIISAGGGGGSSSGGGGSGDMTKAVYDPTNVAGDAFARSNMTGTQTAATISDFDTEVSNNADVTANTTKNSYPTADSTKLAGIEALADVTDETNVVSSLDGATLTSVTVATDDKVIIQDTSDSDNIKTVTAQSIADLAGGGGDNQRMLFTSTDFNFITNQYNASASGTGASAAYASNELRLLSGTTIVSNATVNPKAWDQAASQKFPIFDLNPTMSFTGRVDGNTSDVNGCFAFANVGEDIKIFSAAAPTNNGFGYFHQFSDSGTAVYFWCGNGSSGTLSSDYGSSVTDNEHYTVTMKMTSGTDIECYINGVLKETLTTTLPSGSYTVYPWITGVANAVSDWGSGMEMWPKNIAITCNPV